jgi:hypothetical protein
MEDTLAERRRHWQGGGYTGRECTQAGRTHKKGETHRQGGHTGKGNIQAGRKHSQGEHTGKEDTQAGKTHRQEGKMQEAG